MNAHRKKQKQENRLLYKLPWLLLLPIGLLSPRLAAMYPQLVEKHFAEGFYPRISGFLGFLSAFVRGSAAEFLALLLLIAAVSLLILFIVHVVQGRVRFARLASFLLSLCILAGVMLNLFYWCWGFNYMRVPLAQRMGLTLQDRPIEDLEELCYSLSREAARLRENLPEDENGVFAQSAQSALASVPAAYTALGKTNALFSAVTYPAKAVYASKGMSWCGICGIYIPFTAEANINVDQPPLLRASSAAHETAHYLGVARENEANFVAYLACLYADDPGTVYSGVMLALIHCGNALNDADAARYKAVRATYSEGMLRDIRAYNEYWDAFEGKTEEFVDKMNDAYLKGNQQASGVKSYGEMVDLLLAYYFAA